MRRNFSSHDSEKTNFRHACQAVSASHRPKFISFKTSLTLELSQYRKSCHTFSKCEPLAVAASDFYRLGNALRLYVSVQPAKVVQEGGPESSAIDFAVKTFDCRLDSEIALGSDCQMTAFDRQGLERGLKFLNLQPDQ